MKGIRIDDIGASAKYYNRHIKFRVSILGHDIPLPGILNIGPLRTSRLLGGWAVYDELEPREWDELLNVFEEYSEVPIVSVTACWIDERSVLTPFPKKFPGEAQWLKQRLKEGKVLIANHGLTHCVPGRHMPGLFGSNQTYWREFHSFMDDDYHREHIKRSQEILENFFDEQITLFVPPGNIWCRATYRALAGTNIKKVISSRYMSDSDERMEGIEFISDREGMINIHDRELKLYGSGWLAERLRSAAGKEAY